MHRWIIFFLLVFFPASIFPQAIELPDTTQNNAFNPEIQDTSIVISDSIGIINIDSSMFSFDSLSNSDDSTQLDFSSIIPVILINNDNDYSRTKEYQAISWSN